MLEVRDFRKKAKEGEMLRKATHGSCDGSAALCSRHRVHLNSLDIRPLSRIQMTDYLSSHS